ncbi:MAG: hypothetical protein IJT30_07015 [Muribaculaceae bacterium]|nr:hypothetical protein [Muribaculaceae bacterium]
MNEKEEYVSALRAAVEQCFQAGVNSPVEFQRLSRGIGERTGVTVSASTLMRVWGYLATSSRPSKSSLNTLARYVGCRDFGHFVDSLTANRDSSDDVLSPRISVAEDLAVRDRLRITWQPGRVCVVRYLGNLQFVVEQAQVTKLRPGDTFSCALIIEGEPLYLNNMVRSGEPPVAYVCGKRTGVSFEKLPPPSPLSDDD